MTEPAALALGDLIAAAIPKRVPQGHEQEGPRPAIVVGLPDWLGPGRYPLALVVPFTSYRGQAWIDAAPERYPRFDAGVAGLRSPSAALLDQVVALDLRRVRNKSGRLTAEQYESVRSGLECMSTFVTEPPETAAE